MKMSAGLSEVLSGSNPRGSAVAVNPAFRTICSVTSRRSSWICSIPFDIGQRRKCLPSPIGALHLHNWCWMLRPITIGIWRRSLSIVFHSSFENRVWDREGVACRGMFAIWFSFPRNRACSCAVLSTLRCCPVCSISLRRDNSRCSFRSPQSQRSPMMDGCMPGFSYRSVSIADKLSWSLFCHWVSAILGWLLRVCRSLGYILFSTQFRTWCGLVFWLWSIFVNSRRQFHRCLFGVQGNQQPRLCRVS